MNATVPVVRFRRELSDYVTVMVDGKMPEVDPKVALSPDRVVVTMMDDTAHCLAHLLGQVAELGEILGWRPDLGILVPELAGALHEATLHCVCSDRR
jgi:hypothetical protein